MGPAWPGAAGLEPGTTPDEGAEVGADYGREWAHVGAMLPLKKTISLTMAADAIAYDILGAATTSLPQVCSLIAERAATFDAASPDSVDPSSAPESAGLIRKALMQVLSPPVHQESVRRSKSKQEQCMLACGLHLRWNVSRISTLSP